eukprot:scaffold2408_cov279-Chaetoceros_neogracile.AAC.7
MHHAGVLKDANFSEGTDKKLQIWKHKLIKEVDQCRMKVKKELTLEKVREGSHLVSRVELSHWNNVLPSISFNTTIYCVLK